MEDRQQKIQTGAGLTESRLNTEFIDALKKFGPWLIIALAVGILAFVGWGRLKEMREARTLEAFRALEEARIAGNPDNLVRFADEHAERTALAVQARLLAADTWLFAVDRGVRPGAPAGVVPPEDLLDDAARSALLERAKGEYERVLSETKGHDELWMHTIGAHTGLASIAEATGDKAAVRQHYQEAHDLAERLHLRPLAEAMNERLSTAMTMDTAPVLLPADQVKSALYDGPPTPLLPDEPVMPAPVPAPVPAPATGDSPLGVEPVTPAPAPSSPDVAPSPAGTP